MRERFRNPKATPYRHPLAPFVLGLFERHPRLDEMTLAVLLGAPTRPMRGQLGYLTVAEDLLTFLERQGALERDHGGWWCLASKGKR